MDGMEWLREQELDTLAHLEDEYRSKRRNTVEITNIDDFEVTLKDEQGNISHVHQQNKKMWDE